MVPINPEFVEAYKNILRDAERTIKSGFRSSFLAAHPLVRLNNPLTGLSPLSMASSSLSSDRVDADVLGKAHSPYIAASITEEIQKILNIKQQGIFSAFFDLKSPHPASNPILNALQGRVTNIYEADGRISASELEVRIFESHLLPEFDITKSVPEIANYVHLGKDDYTIEAIKRNVGRVRRNPQEDLTYIPSELLVDAENTFYNLPPELYTAESDRLITSSSNFSIRQVDYLIPGSTFASNDHSAIRRGTVEWNGRYLNNQKRLILAQANGIGSLRLRVIEPFNTRFRISGEEIDFYWPENKLF